MFLTGVSALSTILANRQRVSHQEQVNDQISTALEFLPESLQNTVIGLLKGGAFHVWCHNEQLLVAAKLVILYGTGSVPAWNKEVSGELLLGINDLLYPGEGSSLTAEDDLLALVLRQLGLTNNEGPRHLIARYYELLITAPRTMGTPQGLDLDRAFQAETGITLEQFFAVSFLYAGFFVGFDRASKLLPENYSGRIALFESRIKNQELLLATRDLFSADRSWLQSKFQSEASSPKVGGSSFLLFQQRPLIRLSTGSAVPLTLPFLLDKTSLGMYWILHEHFRRVDPKSGIENFKSYLGRLYQKYASDLLQRTFQGGATGSLTLETGLQMPARKQGVGLPDAILVDGGLVVVFEMSVVALTYELLLSGDAQRFKREVVEKFVPKLEQLLDSIDALLRGDVVVPGQSIGTIRTVFPVLTLLYPYPENPQTWQPLVDAYQRKLRLFSARPSPAVIREPQALTTEELEMFEPNLRSGDIALAIELGRKADSPAARYGSFKNYMMLERGWTEIRNPALEQLFDAAVNEGKKVLRREFHFDD
jgi:hypothetical protein